MIPYEVKVSHELGFFSIYQIEAEDWHDAEREAKKRFLKSFCNPDTPLAELTAYTINKYVIHYKNSLTKGGIK